MKYFGRNIFCIVLVMAFLQKVSFCNLIRNNPRLFSGCRRKKIVLAVASLFFGFSLSAESVFRLSKESVLKGEPLTAQFEFKGGVNVKVPKNIISQNGVTAEYIGTEESVSIINMNVTRKKIVKFRIVTSKDGDQNTPDIVILADGNEVHSGEVSFSVSKEKYVPKNNWFDFGDDLFDGRLQGFGKRAFTEPSEGDLFVKFETTRNTIYLGEPIIGYYNLYYKNVVSPFIERNENKILNFPYFSSDLLSDVTIASKDRVVHGGSEYAVAPYQREVYALTPLKKGVYEIGEAEFLVEGSPTSYFSPRTLVSDKKRVIIKELPSPVPLEFKGEVGDYSVKVLVPSKQFFEGIPGRIRLKIYGEGSGTYINNPLEMMCTTNNKCSFDISMIGENRNRKFVKLKEGGYGFYSELEFEYSVLPKKEGVLIFPKIDFVHFSPTNETYEIKPIVIPDLNIKAKPPIEKEEQISDTNYTNLFIYVLLSLSGAFLVYTFRHDIPSAAKALLSNILSKIKTAIYDLIPEKKRQLLQQKFNLGLEDKDGQDLDLFIGNKKDTLLKNFLIQKGLSKEDSGFLSRVKSSHGNRKFVEILPDLNAESRHKILKIKDQLIQEAKK